MSSCVTAFLAPDGLSPKQIVEHMRDTYGVSITGSLKELESKVIRIGHMGHTAQPIYVEIALAALERTLLDLGYQIQLGRAVGAALSVM